MNSPIKSPSKRKRSDNTITEKALAYFERIQHKDDECEWKRKKTHKCLLCSSECNGHKEWNLAQHISSIHPDIYLEISSGVKEPIAVTRLKLLQNCTEIVAINGRPFSCLLDSGFQSIIKKTLEELRSKNHSLDLNDKNLPVVKDHLAKTANAVRNKIRDEVNGRVLSLLADIVTKNNRSILGVSIRYTFNCVSKTRSIGFIELVESHTGLYLAEVVIKRLEEYEIKLKQVLTVTTDNGSNILKMVRDMDDELQSRIDRLHHFEEILKEAQENFGIDIDDDSQVDTAIDNLLTVTREITDDEALELVMNQVQFQNDQSMLNAMLAEMENCGADFLYDITGVNCAQHTLQLFIKDGLNKLTEPQKNVIELIRNVCKMLRLHSTRNEMAELGIQYRLPRLESKTRWGSMFLMVRVVLNYHKSISAFAVRVLTINVFLSLSICLCTISFQFLLFALIHISITNKHQNLHHNDICC